MRFPALVIAALVASTVACGALVGIPDVTEDPGAVADGSSPEAGSTFDATDGARGDASASDARADADAAKDPFTGGEAHFLQPTESVVLGYDTASGAAKDLTLSANGPFTFPETAYAPRVKTPAANKRCWLKVASAGHVDVRCVVAPDVIVPPGSTSSTTFVPLAGAEVKVTTDLPTTNLFVVFSMPYVTTSDPTANALSTAYVRAIVDGDANKSIDLTRASTFYHQGYNQTLFGTIEVGPGAHTVAVEFEHYVPTAVAGRATKVGATFDNGTGFPIDYNSTLVAVALESMETFQSVTKTAQTDAVLLDASEKDTWKTMTSLSGSAPAPAKAIVTAYYPEVAVTSPGPTLTAAWFSLMSGNDSIASFDFRHYNDNGGTRAVGMLTSLPVSGPFDLRVDQRTELGPNTINAPKAGGALTAMLFSATSAVQSWSFRGDYDYTMPIGEWRAVAGSKGTVTTKGRSIVFASLNRVCTTTNGGVAELGLFDGTTELTHAHTEGWWNEYAQGSIFAAVVDFSTPGPHTIELRVRKMNGGTPEVRHGNMPDNRGISSITVLPLE